MSQEPPFRPRPAEAFPRQIYKPRYKLPYVHENKQYLLVVWPDHRYTLQQLGDSGEASPPKTISAVEADEIICKHVLNSNQSLLAAGLNQAFLKAAEGLRILSDAEHQMQEELERRKGEKG